MRFYILSDLHLEKIFDDSIANDILKRLCREIRKATELNTTILFIILGDIAFRGTDFSFEYAKECLDFIVSELYEYNVKFEFVPGNHDLQKNSLSKFDDIVRLYGNNHSFEDKSTYSNEYAGLNFIFTDSNLSRNHSSPGIIDLESIKKEVKQNKRNILFCHHALSHSHGDTHDTIENSTTVINQLNEMGVNFFFHGHVHQSDVTIPENGLVEIGSGCLSGDLSYTNGNVQHQFTVGYIRDNEIVRIERWVDNTDGNEIFASNQLYPKPKIFADPSTIDRIVYEQVNDYISRSVLSYELATGNSLYRYFNREKNISLYNVLQEHSKILLLCDAGMGKSVEISNLAHVLCDKYHTFLYSLKDYVGEEIEDVLPPMYRTIHPSRIALLFDGYDELSSSLRELFDKMLRRYLKENETVHIIITSRSNFCRVETTNESKTFPRFSIYVLDKLDNDIIRSFLDRKGIDESAFYHDAKAKKVDELLSNPFYLTKLSDIYINDRSLPNKSELMDSLIAEGFELDEDKYSGDLNDRYNSLFKSLETIAFSMQLMHKYVLEDHTEYQELFDDDIRELVKQSGLFKREKTGWSFSHNNFREYLAAKKLSRFSKEEAIEVFSCGSFIKPSWINTLGYFAGLELSWDLQSWLIDNFPSAIVKFESDRLNKSKRIETFKRIFTQYENDRIHFNDELCDTLELARFSNSNEVLSFLLDRIERPQHYISQYTAINILRHFSSLYGKNNEIRDILLRCCKAYPKTDKTICRLAIVALCQLNLSTPQITKQLFEIFGDSEEDYIRLGMYEYLIITKEYDSYAEYFLSGIKYIKYSLNDDENRIGNESFELVNGLKLMSTSKSISEILEWFSSKDYVDFHDSDIVLSNAINIAIKLYLEGNKELYDVVLKCYLSASRGYNNNVEQEMVKFFKETNTQYDASLFAVESFDKKPHHMYYLLNCDETIIVFLKEAYVSGKLKIHSAFHNLVVWFIKDKKVYNEYAQVIKKIDGINIPEYKAPVDYELIKREAAQGYFDTLFDKEKREKLFNELILKIEDNEATANQILELCRDIEYESPLGKLKTAIYHYDYNGKIVEFFDSIDLEDFIIWSASKYLKNKTFVIPTKEQKEILSNILYRKIDNTTFLNAVKYTENGLTIRCRVPHLLTLIVYLDLNVKHEILLQLSELPDFFVKEQIGIDKFSYLLSKLSFQDLKSFLVKNVESGKVKDMVLEDHIEFFDKMRDEALSVCALKVIKEEQDNFQLRYSAWQYIYHLYGAEYLDSEILPFVDSELLMDINNNCKDINRSKMKYFMEKQYKKTQTMQLQAHLISLGSENALVDYVNYVVANKKTPEGRGIHIDGPTHAIRSVYNPEYLPLLNSLLVMLFDKEFEDDSWRGLRTSLTYALVNCSKTCMNATVEMILSCQPEANVDERNFRYCNQIISDIKSAQSVQQDKPLTIDEVKILLKKHIVS